MTPLPVVARELRVASRRPWTYWGRALAGGVALMVFAWIAAVAQFAGAARSGVVLFFALASPAFVFAFCAGLLYTADSVSSEKREGTLGLLFLTDLRGHDVTLGKLAGTSLGAVYGLLSMLPFLAITLLLGGVTGADYLRMALVLLTTLFTSLSTGLLASVLSLDSRRSVLVAFLFMLGVFLFFPTTVASVEWAQKRFGAEPEAATLWSLTPLKAFAVCAGRQFTAEVPAYWTSVGFTGLAGLMALGVANWRLPRAWQHSGDPPGRRSPGGWLKRLRFRTPDAFAQFREPILSRNAVTWLTARHWLRPWLPWLFLAGVAAVWTWLAGWWDPEWWSVEALFAGSVGIHVTFKIWMANEAPRQFLDDRQSGALELLLATPLSPREIVGGQLMALRRQFFGPVLCLLAADVLGLIAALKDYADPGPPVLATLWALRILLLPADLATLAYAGQWAGMFGRSRTATSGLVWRVLNLPWLLWFMLVTTTVLRSGGDNTLWFLIGSWFVLGIATDAFWLLYAHKRLTSGFREAAARRPGERTRWKFFLRTTS
ncbi:MAG: ABC transporter permease [Verrucomicrobiae bacterium]|nr:ABC transporter permease [Verrucomicrobiae bacterium]